MKVQHKVSLVAQQTDARCWSATLQMVKQGTPWWDATRCTAESIANGGLTDFTCNFNTGVKKRLGANMSYYEEAPGEFIHTDPATLQRFAELNNLVVLPQKNYGAAPAELFQLLSLHGPLWAAGFVGPTGMEAGHAFCISGIEGDGTAQGTVITIHDPWPPHVGMVRKARYTGVSNWLQMQTHTTLDHNDIWYLLYARYGGPR